MEITTAMIKELREQTSAGMMDCKKALQESNGDMTKAVDHLRQKGLATAMKREGRLASEGQVMSYIHTGGRIGVLVEVNCETDFAAKSEDFTQFTKDIAMQIAAANPLGIQREDLSADIIERERAVHAVQAKESGKPDHIIDKIVDGRMRKFFEETVLLEQVFIKDTDKKVQDHLNELIAKIGEKVIVRRFARFTLGAE